MVALPIAGMDQLEGQALLSQPRARAVAARCQIYVSGQLEHQLIHYSVRRPHPLATGARETTVNRFVARLKTTRLGNGLTERTDVKDLPGVGEEVRKDLSATGETVIKREMIPEEGITLDKLLNDVLGLGPISMNIETVFQLLGRMLMLRQTEGDMDAHGVLDAFHRHLYALKINPKANKNTITDSMGALLEATFGRHAFLGHAKKTLNFGTIPEEPGADETKAGAGAGAGAGASSRPSCNTF